MLDRTRLFLDVTLHLLLYGDRSEGESLLLGE